MTGVGLELRRSKDFLAGLLFLAIGAGAIVVARAYPFGTAMRMGSGYFPTVLGGILVLFGVFLMTRGARSKERGLVTWGWKPLACIAASMVLFGFLMPRLGLVPALVALFFTAALGGREFRFKEVLALTALMTAFAVGVFVYVLKLPFQLLYCLGGVALGTLIGVLPGSTTARSTAARPPRSSSTCRARRHPQ